jgi:hypothetical protein
MHYTENVEKSKGAVAPFGYTTEAVTVGVPQVLERLVVSGGKYVTIVQGAVPGEAPDAAVPPEIGSVPPVGGTLVSTATQVVVIVNAVLAPFLARVC